MTDRPDPIVTLPQDTTAEDVQHLKFLLDNSRKAMDRVVEENRRLRALLQAVVVVAQAGENAP